MLHLASVRSFAVILSGEEAFVLQAGGTPSAPFRKQNTSESGSVAEAAGFGKGQRLMWSGEWLILCPLALTAQLPMASCKSEASEVACWKAPDSASPEMELQTALKLFKETRLGPVDASQGQQISQLNEQQTPRMQMLLNALVEINYLGNATEEQMFNHLLLEAQKVGRPKDVAVERDFDVVFKHNPTNAVERTTMPPNVKMLREALLGKTTLKDDQQTNYKHLEEELLRAQQFV